MKKKKNSGKNVPENLETENIVSNDMFPVMRGMTREPFTNMALHVSDNPDVVRDWERDL